MKEISNGTKHDDDVKGRFFEAMQNKLSQLGDRGSNEIVPVDFAHMVALINGQ